MSSAAPNGTGSSERDTIIQTDNEIAQVEAELSALMSEDSNLLGGEDVAELLERLSNADNMAKDMESKIDSVLENLDNLLDLLNSSEETKDAVPGSVAKDSSEELREDGPPSPDKGTGNSS